MEASTKLDVVIVQLVLVGAVGWLMYYLAGALGHKQLAGMVKATAIMVMITIGGGALWEFVSSVATKVSAIAEAINNVTDKIFFFVK